MKVLIVYATTDGHTRKIARFLQDRLIEQDNVVELYAPRKTGGPDFERFQAIIFAGSVHTGRFQKELVSFLKKSAIGLKKLPTLFLSVSLSAAGHDADDWKGLDQNYKDLTDTIGWEPTEVEQVAGAYLPSQYDLIRRLMMRHIIQKRDPGADVFSDKEYTDWDKLTQIVTSWVAKQVNGN